MNLPNKISTLRLLLIPVFAAVFYVGFTGHYIVAACVFALAAFTDFLDGYIARKYDLVTDLGKFLDSSADKVLVLAALVFILDANLFPVVILGGVMTALILAREIMISCLRMIAAAKRVVIAADKLGKIKTVLQDVALIILIVSGVHYVVKYRFILTGKDKGNGENK
ncbi:MAG: CDP-diacylglycerol--glycerol-3-phosphate 3-phosphatidyltransferase [Clostridia bacterium]|nr:CDP-diacylglycerol--glycerol-3-phosphate 3-phosphatidyltransferase [Clostridia bacterium]